MAWFTLKSEVMAEDSLHKSKIREICQQTNSSALARRKLFKVPVKKKAKSLTRNNKQRLPLNLSSDEAIKCLEEKLEKRAEEKHKKKLRKDKRKLKQKAKSTANRKKCRASPSVEEEVCTYCAVAFIGGKNEPRWGPTTIVTHGIT